MNPQELHLAIETQISLFDDSYQLEDEPDLSVMSFEELVDRLISMCLRIRRLKRVVSEALDDKDFCMTAVLENRKLKSEVDRIKGVIGERFSK